MMNEKAKELGCTNSNFVNPSGLPNDNHVTLSLIHISEPTRQAEISYAVFCLKKKKKKNKKKKKEKKKKKKKRNTNYTEHKN